MSCRTKPFPCPFSTNVASVVLISVPNSKKCLGNPTLNHLFYKKILAVPIALFYFHHTVSHTNMCLNILWRLLCRLQFFSQCRHKYPQRSYIVIPTAAPHILRDKGMGQYLANILGQQAQQLIFNGCQVKFVFIQIRASRGIIHFQLTINKYRTGCLLYTSPSPRD